MLDCLLKVTAATVIYTYGHTLSLHGVLPVCAGSAFRNDAGAPRRLGGARIRGAVPEDRGNRRDGAWHVRRLPRGAAPVDGGGRTRAWRLYRRLDRGARRGGREIGRASCGESGGQYVWVWVVGGYFKKQIKDEK